MEYFTVFRAEVLPRVFTALFAAFLGYIGYKIQDAIQQHSNSKIVHSLMILFELVCVLYGILRFLGVITYNSDKSMIILSQQIIGSFVLFFTIPLLFGSVLSHYRYRRKEK